MPIVRRRASASASSSEPGEFGARDLDRARARLLQTGDHGEQGRLAGARRPDQPDRFALGDIEIDAFEDIHGTGPAGEGQLHAAELNCHRGGH